MLGEPAFTADGGELLYSVTATDTPARAQSDLWAAGWAGGKRRLTNSRDRSEWMPQPLAGGRVAFLSDGAADGSVQLWAMPLKGGRARQLTRIPGGIGDYSLSPDGRQAVVTVETGAPEYPADGPEPPIVVDRFQNRQDGAGWLDARRSHLALVSLADGAARLLTSGDYDHWLPSWSPDGHWIAFVSKRCADADRRYCSDVYVMPAAGGEARRLSRHEGADADPDFEAGRPSWSPDSRRLAWVRAGDERLTWYSPFRLVVADLDSGDLSEPGPADRWVYAPRWTADGQILALVEEDRATRLAAIRPDTGDISYLTPADATAVEFASHGPRVAVLLGGSAAPPALWALDAPKRLLASHNEWLAERQIAETRPVSWASGDAEIHGLLMLPPDHREGQPLPLIVRLHGGPVWQWSHEFMADWQAFAARGYAVLAPNPRGSSGRGEAFARAQMADWGNADVNDVRTGIDHLIATGIADPARIGVGGWSYGGILTNYLIARDPRIRAAVSGAGMGNFLGGYGVDQYSRDYELELGRPWENSELWRKLSYPFFEADRIQTPTLYLCAEADSNVPCSGSQQMFQALKSLNIPTRLVIYPGENHGLTVPAYRVDRVARELDWYGRFLAE
ncbi:S9 family peptidase [Sandaracinobacter neustonicus]|uniref:S9 family peptidase n=1 Tax=Sandaracinobacter neustonicus TaxID=1715348 RepID=UPI001A9C3565|nr:S9 family peptidase [Sandaracinobacter neustonicus]